MKPSVFRKKGEGSLSEALNLSAKFSNYINPSFQTILGIRGGHLLVKMGLIQ